MVIWIPLFLVIIITYSVRLILFFQAKNGFSQGLFKRQRELSYLNFLTESSTNEKDSIEKSLPRYLNTLKEIVGWDFHSIYQLDESMQLLHARFTGYLPDWFMEEMGKKVSVKVGDVAVGRAVASKQPVTTNAVFVDPRFKDVTSILGEIGFRSLTCCPLLGRLKVYGGFCTYSQYKNIFTIHDAQFLLTCAYLYAVFLENKLITNYLSSFKAVKPV